MSGNNRSYSTEFIKESVKYAISAPSITGAAKDLGIPEATLHTWVKKAKRSGEAEIDSNQHVNVGEVIDELKALKRKVAVLEQEKAILKKAATCVPQVHNDLKMDLRSYCKAIRKMKVGPSVSAVRSRYQTVSSCCC